MGSANSGTTGMSVKIVGVHTHSCNVLIRPGDLAGNLIGRGEISVRVSKMVPFLREYPNREAAVVLFAGFSKGFSIPCSSPPPLGKVCNLSSGLARPEVVAEKRLNEVLLGRMAGLFMETPIFAHFPVRSGPQKGA